MARPPLAVAGAAFLIALSCVTPAAASTPGCSLDHHCYSIVNVTDTLREGISGTTSRSVMSAGASSTYPGFIDSEFWLVRHTSTLDDGWVEGGLTEGSGSGCTGLGYFAFAAWQDSSGTYGEKCFGAVTANDSTTDQFTVKRSTTTNQWRIYFNGTYTLSPVVGFWQGYGTEYGGEVATSRGTSHQFHLHAQAISTSGNLVNMGDESQRRVDTPLYGTRPGESLWNWGVTS